jgi:cell division protein ZapB
MSHLLLESLESKIDAMLENVALLQLQVEELEQQNAQLQQENSTLKGHQSQWTQGLQTLIHKLDTVQAEPLLQTKRIPEHEAF